MLGIILEWMIALMMIVGAGALIFAVWRSRLHEAGWAGRLVAEQIVWPLALGMIFCAVYALGH